MIPVLPVAFALALGWSAEARALGSPRWRDRESAQGRLGRAGPLAVPVLLVAATSPDPERALRARLAIRERARCPLHGGSRCAECAAKWECKRHPLAWCLGPDGEWGRLCAWCHGGLYLPPGSWAMVRPWGAR